MEIVLRFLQVTILMLFFASSGQTAPKADAFMIELYGGKAKVTSPRQHHPRTHLIIANKTLTPLMGRVEDGAGKSKKYVSVGEGDTLSFRLGIGRTEKLLFVPLSPPLQAFELQIGKPFYEIPPQR